MFIIQLMCLTMLCGILSCCGGFIGGGGISVTYNCDWENEKRAIFYDPDLLAPCSLGDCEYVFQNPSFENVLDHHGICYIMQQVCNNYLGVPNFDFKWTVTVASGKTCSGSSDQYRSISMNQDSYTQYFTNSGQDVMEHSPLNSNISASEHKHEMVFQIHNVENLHDAKVGTVTWKYTWYKPSNENGEEIVFNGPVIEGDFKPGRTYSPTRKIYYFGHFQNI